MKYTKEEIENLKNNPMINLASILTNVSVNDIVNEILKESEKEEAVERTKESIKNEEFVPEVKANNVNLDHNYDCQNPDELLESGSEKSMSLDDLRTWINKYQNLENLFQKLGYTFGIKLDSIHEKYNELVWDLLKVIFGEDGQEDIADFCFGNSNFDSVENLYSQL